MPIKPPSAPSKQGSFLNQNFILGLVSGVAVVALIGFVGLLAQKGGVEDDNTTAPVAVEQPAGNQPAQPAQPTQPTPPTAAVPVVSDSDYIRGDVNAKVTLIEYSDFECPFCSRFLPSVEQALEEFEGDVRLVYRHFPLSFHPEAQKAAEAAECAGEQGKFYEMHDKIFEANTSKSMSVATWKQYADNFGLDTAIFDSCLDSGKYASKVAQQMAGGQAAGVKGTPATFVNGQLVSGAVPYEQLKAAIEAKLAS